MSNLDLLAFGVLILAVIAMLMRIHKALERIEERLETHGTHLQTSSNCLRWLHEESNSRPTRTFT